MATPAEGQVTWPSRTGTSMATPSTALLPAQVATAPENNDVLPLQGEVPAEQAEGAQNPKSPSSSNASPGPPTGRPLRPRRNPPPKHEQSAPSQPQPRTHLPLKGPEDGGHRRSHLKSSRWETPSGGGALKPEVLPLQGEVPAEQAEGAPKPKVALSAATPRRPHPRDARGAHNLDQPRPSRSERERQRTKRRIWHRPIDSSSPEPIDTQTRQPARDQTPAVEPCKPSTIGTGPAQGVQGDVRSSPPAGGARGGRSSPRKTGGVWGRSPPLKHEQSAPSQPQSRNPVFCRRRAQLVRVGDP